MTQLFFGVRTRNLTEPAREGRPARVTTHEFISIRVHDQDTGEIKDLRPRYDEMNYSPTGFEWGYSGSGPHQLAYAILRERMLARKEDFGKEKARLLMYDYTREVIAELPKERFELTEGQIDTWLAGQQAIRTVVENAIRPKSDPVPSERVKTRTLRT